MTALVELPAIRHPELVSGSNAEFQRL